MSQKYALSRVRDAIETSGGDLAQAKRLIMSWLENDQSLLTGLVEPHINGIIMHALTYAQRHEKATLVEDESGKVSNMDEDELTAALSQGLGNEHSHEFGTPGSTGGKPAKASQDHIDAINQIARKVEKPVD